MIGSFSMSCQNFLTSLILSHLEIPVEYRLITCLPKAFPVFSRFSLSLRCFYSAYVLLKISSLALSTLPHVHLFSNKCALPLSMTLFSSSRFLCCSMLSFGVSTTSLKNSLLFNMSPKSAIIFIKCRNRYHMKNNIRYKGNFNNTSVIIVLIGRQKLPAMLLCLGEPLVRFFDAGCCFVLHFVVILHFLLLLFFIFVVVHHSLLFNVIPRPSMDYRWVFTPILYFQPSPSQSDSRHFHFNLFEIFFHSFTGSATVLNGHFLSTGAFLGAGVSSLGV